MKQIVIFLFLVMIPVSVNAADTAAADLNHCLADAHAEYDLCRASWWSLLFGSSACDHALAEIEATCYQTYS